MVTLFEWTYVIFTELVETCLSRAKRLQSLNAFTCFREEQVRQEAAEADQRHLVFFIIRLPPEFLPVLGLLTR